MDISGNPVVDIMDMLPGYIVDQLEKDRVAPELISSELDLDFLHSGGL